MSEEMDTLWELLAEVEGGRVGRGRCCTGREESGQGDWEIGGRRKERRKTGKNISSESHT